MGRVLNMKLDLLENELRDELEPTDHLDIAEEDQYLPTIVLHFNDDLSSM